MLQIKPLTQQIKDHAITYSNFLKSQNYQNQIQNQELSNPNTPYKYGDDSLGEIIDNLKKILTYIIDNPYEIDIINFNIKEQLFNNLNNLVSWQELFLQNWQNVIQTNYKIDTCLTQSGINYRKLEINEEEEKNIKGLINIIKKLKPENLKVALEAISQSDKIQKILNNYSEISEWENEIKDKAKHAQETINDLNDKIKVLLEQIQETKSKANKVLGDASNARFVKHYSDAHKEYKIVSRFWLGSVAISFALLAIIILAVTNIFTCINLGINNSFEYEYFDLLTSLTKRVTCVTFGFSLLYFCIRGYNRAIFMKERYGFKHVSSAILEGHIEALRDRLQSHDKEDKIRDLTLKIMNDLYIEPNFENKSYTKNDLNLLNTLKEKNDKSGGVID